MHINIINDCRDQNAIGRQIIRTSSLFKGASVSFLGVASDIEASGNLIDALDAFSLESGVVLVNVAPRNGEAKKWPNGTPFCFFQYKNVLVVSSFDGYTLSLVKKLRLVNEVTLLDIPTALTQMIEQKYLEEDLKEQITNTQFRSYNFTPRVASFLFCGGKLKGEYVSIEKVLDPLNCVWCIDNFGNCKTTILSKEKELKEFFLPKFKDLKFYPKLKDVPDSELALIEGSSGLLKDRFLEIVIQGGNAKEKLNINLGEKII